MSNRGTPKICPKPCTSVSFDFNPVDISDLSQLHVNETITHNEQIQPVELEHISEVESNDSESEIDPFTTMYGEG